MTGSAGFVGFHSSLALKARGDAVIGLDNFNDYYPTALKYAREAELERAGVYTVHADLNNEAALDALLGACRFTHVLHLAAQAGVRYALQNPLSYTRSNVDGFITLLEALRAQPGGAPAIIAASSSSVYGLNTKVRNCLRERAELREAAGGILVVTTKLSTCITNRAAGARSDDTLSHHSIRTLSQAHACHGACHGARLLSCQTHQSLTVAHTLQYPLCALVGALF